MLAHSWRMAVVDDDQVILRLVSDVFASRGWLVDVYVDAESAVGAMRATEYDIAVVDVGLPGRSGLQLIEELREAQVDTEVMVVTGSTALQHAIDAVSLRAFAYLTKPMDVDRLIAEVDKAREIIGLRRENQVLVSRVLAHEQELKSHVDDATKQLAAMNRQLAETNRELTALATHDSLTTLHNYRYFSRRFADEVERTRRYGSPFGLALLDVDHFKQFNDTHGHVAGNHALVHIAHHLKQHLRVHDVAARIGGEEFAAILFQCDRPRLAMVAERVRGSLESALCPGLPGDTSVRVTVSVGLVMCPDDGADTDVLLERADRALYTAKRLGRNRIVSWEEVVTGRLPLPASARAAQPTTHPTVQDPEADHFEHGYRPTASDNGVAPEPPDSPRPGLAPPEPGASLA